MAFKGRAAGQRGRRATQVRSQLFSVRLWKEEVAAGSEYRGSVRDVISGAFLNFRDWSDLAAFMVGRLEEDEVAQAERSEGGGGAGDEEVMSRE
jgi:hypothetical protein